ARIWNYARSATQILAARDREIPTASGLLGRWSFNDWGGATFVEADSSGHNQTGTIIGPSWMLATTGVAFSTTPNLPPVVNAGPDLSVALPAAASLIGSISDDNVPGGPVTAAWSKTSGPGTVTFSNPTSAITNAAFSDPG